MSRRHTTARRPSFRPACEPLESRLAPAVFTVTTTIDILPGSLPWAITSANNHSGQDTIRFNIPGGGVKTIPVFDGLPTITDAVVIDGYSQPGASENSAPLSFNANLRIQLRGFGDGGSGLIVNVAGGSGVVIKGLILRDFYASGLKLERCGGGVLVGGNIITENRIGGVDVGQDCLHARIGAQGPAWRNLINGNGVTVSGGGVNLGSLQAEVANNLIGLTPDGNHAYGNGTGVRIAGSSNTVGGNSALKGNVISGNAGAGIFVNGGTSRSSDNMIFNNRIGTNAAGTAAVPNDDGVILFENSLRTQIGRPPGGGGEAFGNLISGNTDDGVRDLSDGLNTIQANRIGTTADGTHSLRNLGDGVEIHSDNNTIGGGENGAGNLISGNNGHGIKITGRQARDNLVLGNQIGTTANGTLPLSNLRNGVYVNGSDNVLADNTIAYNAYDYAGVQVVGGTGNRITINRIFGNSGLGIALGAGGVTANDYLDADTGPNGLQNFPSVTSALQGDSALRVFFTLHSKPNGNFRIELFGNASCDPSGHGEGRTFLAAVNGQTNSVGDLPTTQVVSNSRVRHNFVTATATNLTTNDTSEFSACEQVQPDPFSAPGADGGWMADLLLADETEAAIIPLNPASEWADARRADAFWVEYRAAGDIAPTVVPRWTPARRTDLAEAIRLDGGL